MDRQPVLHGDRLVLRPLRPADWEAHFAVAADPEIWAHHPSHDRWQEPVFLQLFADGLERGGALAIVDKASGAVIGSSQYGLPDPARPGEIEIGWTFVARHLWGGGYNAAFKRLMLAHALRYVDRVTFQVGEDNLISRKAMSNIGGALTDRVVVIEKAGKAIRHVIYKITRDSFAAGPLAG